MKRVIWMAALSFILNGCTGPEGPAGADGSAGPAGVDGAEGLDGADGADGPAGADGPSSPAGLFMGHLAVGAVTGGSSDDFAVGGQIYAPTENMYCRATVTAALLNPGAAAADASTRFAIEDLANEGVYLGQGSWSRFPHTTSGEFISTTTAHASFALSAGATYRFGCEIGSVPGITNFDCSYSFLCAKQLDVAVFY